MVKSQKCSILSSRDGDGGIARQGQLGVLGMEMVALLDQGHFEFQGWRWRPCQTRDTLSSRDGDGGIVVRNAVVYFVPGIA